MGIGYLWSSGGGCWYSVDWQPMKKNCLLPVLARVNLQNRVVAKQTVVSWNSNVATTTFFMIYYVMNISDQPVMIQVDVVVFR